MHLIFQSQAKEARLAEVHAYDVAQEAESIADNLRDTVNTVRGEGLVVFCVDFMGRWMD